MVMVMLGMTKTPMGMQTLMPMEMPTRKPTKTPMQIRMQMRMSPMPSDRDWILLASDKINP